MRQLTEKRLISLIAKAQDARKKASKAKDREKLNGIVSTLMWMLHEEFTTEAWLEVSEDGE